MPTAAEIEARLTAQHAVLTAVIEHLRRREPLARWPEAHRRPFILALSQPRGAPAEAWKVTALRRHLFGTTELPQLDALSRAIDGLGDLDREASERLRAELPGLVRLRAASGLID